MAIDECADDRIICSSETILSRACVPPIATLLQLSERHQVAGEVFTESHIEQSNDPRALEALCVDVHIAVSAHCDTAFACNDKVVWRRWAVFLKPTNVVEDMKSGT